MDDACEQQDDLKDIPEGISHRRYLPFVEEVCDRGSLHGLFIEMRYLITHFWGKRVEFFRRTRE
jgi:hypothetical protein